MGDIRQFTLGLKKYGDRQPQIISQIMRSAALRLFREVVLESPVDTGRFKSSWFVGVGAPNRDIMPERAANERDASGRDSLGRIEEISPSTVDGTKPLYLSNNLPYGVRLSEGHSDQAANGWIDRAVTREAVRSAVVKVNTER